jgi:SAM-dependent methyltransferase
MNGGDTQTMNLRATYRPCPACSSDAVTALDYAPDPWAIGQCDACGLVFLRNPVDYTALEVEHAWETTYETAHQEREEKRGPLRRAARQVRHWGYAVRGSAARVYLRHLSPGPILDIGCGDVVRFDAPYVPYGIELSKTLAARADAEMRERGGYCLQGAGAERIGDFPENHFSGVLMHSFLEHEVNFPDLLRGCLRVLKPGGRAFIRVPNFAALNRRIQGANWAGFRHPDHVNYFTPDTLAQACATAGFDFTLVNRHKIWLDDNIQGLAIKPAA